MSIMHKKKFVKVLFVGDNPPIADIVAKEKTLLSHKPLKGSNGKKTLQVASKQPPFYFLLTDIMEPEINGVSFVEHLLNCTQRSTVLHMIF
jgi:CheY-like chemotaxis protein